MRIVIAGPGALGCLLAARISSALAIDDELTLLDHRQDRARQINSTGFTLEERGKSKHFIIPATADPASISGCDLFFLCTRAGSVAKTLKQTASLLTPSTLLISMQRGISHLATIADNPAITGAALTSTDVFPEGPGKINCPDPGKIHIGLFDNSAENGQLLDRAVDLLDRAGLSPAATENILQQIWDGFFVDLAFNALAAIYRRPNGQLLTSCSVRGNMKKLLKEAILIAEAAGIKPGADPVKVAFQFLRTNKDRVAPMFRDIQNNRPTEIDALNGTISQMGKELSIPTPINDDMVMRIKKLERGYLAS
jgi:2-dehydropantoate 2-reductase